MKKSLEKFKERYEAYLKTNAPKSSGTLKNSISGIVDGDGVAFEMLEYANFVERGINGTERGVGSPYSFNKKKPPISSLIGYSASVGINPYALQNSLFKKGIKPQPFLQGDGTLDKEINTLGDNIIEELWEKLAKNEKINN